MIRHGNSLLTLIYEIHLFHYPSHWPIQSHSLEYSVLGLLICTTYNDAYLSQCVMDWGHARWTKGLIEYRGIYHLDR